MPGQIGELGVWFVVTTIRSLNSTGLCYCTVDRPMYVAAFCLFSLLTTDPSPVRDSRRWLTDADEIEQREVVCWELTSAEVWQVCRSISLPHHDLSPVFQAFHTGRESSVDLTLVDCPRPSESASGSVGCPDHYPGCTLLTARTLVPLEFISLSSHGLALPILHPPT